MSGAPTKDETALSAPTVERRLSPSILDDIALSSFLTGDPAPLVEHIRGMAEALTLGNDRAGARQRLIARALASEQVVHRLLQRLLGVHATKGDAQGVLAIEKALTGSVKRMTALAEQHRHDMELERRPSVAVSKTIIDVGVVR